MTIQPGRVGRTLFGLLLCILTASARDARAAGQTLHEVVFTQYTELAGNTELARRLLSPLQEARLRDSGQEIAGRSIDLAQEKFLVYLPSQRGADRYGLLVFVPPWQDARLPAGWAAVLDRLGVVFVSPARSGNSENALGRRAPLALLAAYNVMRQYPVDPERVYIGGFSGGSRVALRLALAYPDVFRGAVLNAGSDPIGGADLPLPPSELFAKFQVSTRIAYVTGEQDTRTSDDLASARAMHEWCSFSLDSYLVPRLDHEVAPAEALAWALGKLLKGASPDLAKLTACRATIESELAARLQEVESLIERGQRADAERLLRKIDERFGGLAAPRSVELSKRL